MRDADKYLTIRAGEKLAREIDATPYLLTGQYVTAAAVEHTPPDGAASGTFTTTLDPVTNSTAVVWKMTDEWTSEGWHMLDVSLTLTGGEVKVFRYWVFFGG